MTHFELFPPHYTRLCSKTRVCVSWPHVCHTHIPRMLLGTRGHAVDELSAAAKVCTLSSPSACKKNGSFTSFFEPPRSSQRQMAAPPPPPLCGRQVAMLLAFTVGRHTQKRWVGKDSSLFGHPVCPLLHAGSPCLDQASPLTSVTLHNTQPKSKGGLIALQHLSVHVGVSEWGLEGKYSTSRVHIFLHLGGVIKTQHATKREESIAKAVHTTVSPQEQEDLSVMI